VDFILITLVAALAAISIVAISSATYTEQTDFMQKQILWYIVGFLCMILFLLFDYKILMEGRFLDLLYGLSIFLLLLVWVPGIGIKVNGAKEWLRIGGIQVEPSEVVKLILILVLAKHLAAKKCETGWWDPKTLCTVLGLVALPFFLILSQPDLGMALLLTGILAAMLFVSGLDWRFFAAGLILVVLAAGSVFFLYTTHSPLLHVILKKHQIERIATFLNPSADPTGAGFQTTQAKIAIGSGMLKGKGFHQGTQAQGKWIPEPHNDFIFAVFAEEFGFIGSSVLITLFFLLIWRMVGIAEKADHPFGALIVSGVIGMMVFQVFQNIGMTLGLVPVTGLPLPLISYGGSSLVTQLAAIGLVLNVGMRSNRDLLTFDG
jgi:rod shape-determining protein RodA